MKLDQGSSGRRPLPRLSQICLNHRKPPESLGFRAGGGPGDGRPGVTAGEGVSGVDGVDAPRRHLSAKVVVSTHHLRRRPWGPFVAWRTLRQRGRKFGETFANRMRRRLPRAGAKWHLDEVVIKIAGVTHQLWREDGIADDLGRETEAGVAGAGWWGHLNRQPERDPPKPAGRSAS